MCASSIVSSHVAPPYMASNRASRTLNELRALNELDIHVTELKLKLVRRIFCDDAPKTRYRIPKGCTELEREGYGHYFLACPRWNHSDDDCA